MKLDPAYSVVRETVSVGVTLASEWNEESEPLGLPIAKSFPELNFPLLFLIQ